MVNIQMAIDSLYLYVQIDAARERAAAAATDINAVTVTRAGQRERAHVSICIDRRVASPGHAALEVTTLRAPSANTMIPVSAGSHPRSRKERWGWGGGDELKSEGREHSLMCETG